MNISTLSQQLNMSVQELRLKMAELGFKVSPKQRKLDNAVAKDVLQKIKPKAEPAPAPAESDSKKISVPPHVIVKDLAAKMKLPVVDVIKALIKNGVMAAMNEEIDFDTASVVAADFGFEVEIAAGGGKNILTSGYAAEVQARELADAKTASEFRPRPPIVAVMGHVDHGKTTLLDTLRKTNVAAGEAGAITQHIGAYQVPHQGKVITFLDTPGHEAFTQMRARGANVTDIIILVVAADDGVKPQTIEVINRARLANVPMIVAINKIDKPDATPDRVKQQLSENGVLIEEWGGKVPAVAISAKTGQGLNELLDMVLLVAEVENFQANPRGQVAGTVIESHVAKGQGSVATVIVQNGTLKIGDLIVAGQAFGKIRSLESPAGEKIRQVGPGDPAQVQGLSELPQAGDIFRTVATLDQARSQARELAAHLRDRRLLRDGLKGSGKQLNLILKADVQGSLEAIVQALDELKSRTAEVQLNVIDQSVGEIAESDVLRAESAGATIVAFNTKTSAAANALAKTKKVPIDIYNIIYELIEDVTKALVAMLSPEVIRTVLGQAKILAVFRTDSLPQASGARQIIGGKVEGGKITDNGLFTVKRAGQEIGSGKIEELQRNKQAANVVESGQEFGLRVESTVRINEGDVLEIYTEEVRARKLE